MGRIDARSDSAREYRKLYKTSRWSRLRQWQLDQQPLCERCLLMGVVEEATVVHHRAKHVGSADMFFDAANLESLCKPHHDRDGHLEDNGKTVVRFGSDGWPL